jgi:hypothetical protein
VTQIDEIAAVRQYLPGRITAIGTVRLEGADAVLSQGFGVPLPLVSGKESKGRSTDSLRVERRILDTPRCADVSPDVFHGSAVGTGS